MCEDLDYRLYRFCHGDASSWSCLVKLTLQLHVLSYDKVLTLVPLVAGVRLYPPGQHWCLEPLGHFPSPQRRSPVLLITSSLVSWRCHVLHHITDLSPCDITPPYLRVTVRVCSDKSVSSICNTESLPRADGETQNYNPLVNCFNSQQILAIRRHFVCTWYKIIRPGTMKSKW